MLYLKQVKDAIAEPHYKYAGGLVEINSSDFGPSLVEEVFGTYSPAATYIAETSLAPYCCDVT